MAASANDVKAAKYFSDGTYEIEWPGKPLGFSIVMDTTGKNAYVSSIQKSLNVERGLKLAAQIVMVNGDKTEDKLHNEILNKIKNAKTPIKLRFKPRSFANNPDASKKDATPPFLQFDGAKVNQKRINGHYQLVLKGTDKRVPEGLLNGKPVWKRATQKGEEDLGDNQIYCYFWPKTKNSLGHDLWMISRGEQFNTDGAYACYKVTEETEKLPTDCMKDWQTYDPAKKDFVPSKIKMTQSEAGK